jgi:cytochrome c peroxidase
LQSFENRVTKKAAKNFSALMALMALEVTGPIHAQNLSPGGPGLRNQPGAPDVPVPTRRTAEGPAFVKLYKEAFPQGAAAARAARDLNLLINHTTTLGAMATFMRTVITRNTAFDRFPAGDNGALSQNQLLGARLFFTSAIPSENVDRSTGGAGCFTCHSGPILNKQRGDNTYTRVEQNLFNIGFNDHSLQALNTVVRDDLAFRDQGLT